MAQILIIEDEVLLAKSVGRAMTGYGHECVIAGSAEEGLALLEKNPADIVLLDLQLPGMSGLEAIKEIRKFDSNISVIVATAHGTMAAVVEAMRFGASDFLRKPLDMEEVSLSVKRAVDGARLRQTVSYYHDVEAGRAEEDPLVAQSAPMKKIIPTIERLTSLSLDCASDYPPVLILGETGVGKDLIARKIHFGSRLSEQPFIEVNCTTLPRGLEEAELFGYEKGAFTGADRSKRGLFEVATGGTIFLNEIGDLVLEAQAKLLQIIEQKTMRRVGGLRDIEIDLRVIAASNKDLKDPTRFREDLYYRLSNIRIELPTLRERIEDILPLAELMLRRASAKYKRSKALDQSAKDALRGYDWPGNVRELRHLMERMTFMGDGPVITASELGLISTGGSQTMKESRNPLIVEFPPEGIDLEQIEKQLIIKALDLANNNVSDAARKLRIGREALRYRINKYRLE